MLVYTTTSYKPLSRKRKALPKKPHKPQRAFVPYKETRVYRPETKQYKSLDMGAAFAAKVEPQKYTGTLIKGIATMHKSNAVPIIDEQHAKDIASMRR